MKVLKAILIMTFTLMVLGCDEQYAIKKVSFKNNLIEFYIPDSELVAYELKDFHEDNVHISVGAFDYSELKQFEPEAYSSAAMNIFYNSDSNRYEKLLEYLRTFDFSTNDFAIFSDYNGYGSTSKKMDKEIIKNASLKTGMKIGVSRCVNGTLAEGSIVAPFVKKEVEAQKAYLNSKIETAKKISELERQEKMANYYKQLYGN